MTLVPIGGMRSVQHWNDSSAFSFELAMGKLALNGVSDPVRTPFGWHLIQVLERRKEDVTLEKSRDAARSAIRSRKSEESYQDWLRQLRDRAYVEYRLEDR